MITRRNRKRKVCKGRREGEREERLRQKGPSKEIAANGDDAKKFDR